MDIILLQLIALIMAVSSAAAYPDGWGWGLFGYRVNQRHGPWGDAWTTMFDNRDKTTGWGWNQQPKGWGQQSY